MVMTNEQAWILGGRLPAWLDDAVLAYKRRLDTYDGPVDYVVPTKDAEQANLIVSRKADGTYLVLIDADYDTWDIPSSTEGHSHLYLNVPGLTKRRYKRLMRALGRAGVVEKGFARSACRNEHGAALRLPWVRKEDVS
jgi:hypothetical protein